MLRMLVFAFCCLWMMAFLAADTLIRTVSRIDTVVNGAVKESVTQGEETLWIGKDRLAIHADDRILILDRKAAKFIWVNPKRKTWVETPLPFELANFCSEALKNRYKGESAGASVRETGASRKILGLACREYEVAQWKTTEGKRGDSRTIRVFATADLPVPTDLSLFTEVMEITRRVYNRDEDSLRQLRQIRGIQARLEFDAGPGRLYVEEVSELAEKEPPPWVYAVPEGYTRLARFDFSE